MLSAQVGRVEVVGEPGVAGVEAVLGAHRDVPPGRDLASEGRGRGRTCAPRGSGRPSASEAAATPRGLCRSSACRVLIWRVESWRSRKGG